MDQNVFLRMLGLRESPRGPDPNFDFEKICEERTKRQRELESFRLERADSFLNYVGEMAELEKMKREEILRINEKVDQLIVIDQQLFDMECRMMLQSGIYKQELTRKRKASEELKEEMEQEQPSKKRCMEECVRSATAGSATGTTKLATSPRLPPQTLTKRRDTLDEIVLEESSKDANAVVLGPNGTIVSKNALQLINWSLSNAAITRKLLVEVFDRETLASHTLSGKPSPAFIGSNKPLKGQLDPAKVADILHFLSKNFNMELRQVRSAITTKCADENKMRRQRQAKRSSIKQEGEAVATEKN